METHVEKYSLSLIQTPDYIVLPTETLVTIFNNTTYQEQAKLSRLDKAYNSFFQDKQCALAQHKSKFFCMSRPLRNLIFSIKKVDGSGLGPELYFTHSFCISNTQEKTELTYLIPKPKAEKLFNLLSNKNDELSCLQTLLSFFISEGTKRSKYQNFLKQPSFAKTITPTHQIFKELITNVMMQHKAPVLTDKTGIPDKNYKKNPSQRRL